MKVKIVWGAKRTNAGTYPLKNPKGPNLAVYMTRSIIPLNSPGLAFMARVFNTSNGCVKVVAIAPYEQQFSIILS